MKRLVPSMLILGLAACGQIPDQREQPATDRRAADSATSSAPGIAVTTAPGVAFTYSYDFRLPAARIAGAQEIHAQACEKLGIARCRITGMRYTLTRDNQVAAALAFKLDPALARAFGRQGIAAIEAAEGMLTNAEITGSDAAGQIAQIEAARARIAEERERIDTELARPGASGAARAELLRQRGDLDAQGRSASVATAEQRAALANTPMTFNYESGTAVRGFDPQSPLTDAVNTAIDSAKFTLTLLLGAIAALAPTALVLGLIFLLGRWIHRRWPLGKSMRAETPATD